MLPQGDEGISSWFAASSAANYVGSESCQPCHVQAYATWRKSHHGKSMSQASAETILGNFESGVFEHKQALSTFYKEDDRWVVRTNDSGGQLQEYDISYTFGFEPLQQYLIGFPDGRYQALSIVADVRQGRGENSQWYHLYPDEAFSQDDPLHWTGYLQNWNFMCADCHSTNLRKGFDVQTNTYQTTFSEVSVGCEACHGPASNHLSWTESGDSQVANRGFAVNLGKADVEIEVCGRCHSRRGILAEGFAPGKNLLDHYRPALLSQDLYHADGQILDEVFVYGSFLQSRMHERGVTCGDCHQPHNAGVNIAANGTCVQCHQQQPPSRFPSLTAKNYDATSHHFHEQGSVGAQCVSCHMPTKNFMGIDPRHDHSLRIPRPDLSTTLGVPNACENCHAEKGNQWAFDQILAKYPNFSTDSYAQAFANGRARTPEAPLELAAIARDVQGTPPIVRGTALSLIHGFDSFSRPVADVVNLVIASGLKDSDALVRIGALMALSQAPLEQRWRKAGPLLDDPLLAVRLEAVTVLAATVRLALTDSQRQRLDRVMTEYRNYAALNADRPESHTNLGNLLVAYGDYAGARQAFEGALKIDSNWVSALLNLADLNRLQARDGESSTLFATAMKSAGHSADVRLAYGLWLTRQGDIALALTQFAKAVDLAPDNPRMSFVYAIALNSQGDTDKALVVLETAHARARADRDLLSTLVSINLERQELSTALSYAYKLGKLYPQDQSVLELIHRLEAQTNK